MRIPNAQVSINFVSGSIVNKEKENLMSQRKRFRSAIAVVLVLLLTAALAPAAVAQEEGDAAPGPPPPDPPVEVSPTPAPPEPGPTGTATADPTDSPDPPDPEVTPTPENGGKDNGMMSTPSSHSWPPPNAIVRHAATPVQISALGGGLHVYLVAPGAEVTSGPVLPSFSELAEMYPSGDPVSLYSGTNPSSGKSVMIDYLPDAMKIRVSTYYADKPPHDFNKPYVFTVDADHSVNHERW